MLSALHADDTGNKKSVMQLCNEPETKQKARKCPTSDNISSCWCGGMSAKRKATARASSDVGSLLTALLLVSSPNAAAADVVGGCSMLSRDCSMAYRPAWYQSHGEQGKGD